MRVTTLLTGAIAALAILTNAAVLVKYNTTITAVDGDDSLTAGKPPTDVLAESDWQRAKTGYKSTTQWWRLDPDKDYGCYLKAQYLQHWDENWQTRWHVQVLAHPGTVADELYPNDPHIVARDKAIQKDMLETWVEAFFVSNDKQGYHYKKIPQARVTYNYKSTDWEAESVESQYWTSYGKNRYIQNQVRAVKDWEGKTMFRCRVYKEF